MNWIHRYTSDPPTPRSFEAYVGVELRPMMWTSVFMNWIHRYNQISPSPTIIWSVCGSWTAPHDVDLRVVTAQLLDTAAVRTAS
jgi:hypothetical protein